MNRRDLIKKTLCATAGSAAFTSMFGKLQLAQAATPESRILAGAGNDYRALVCIYLYGGNDSFSMVVPRSGSAYTTYAAQRGALAIPSASLLALNPTTAPSDGNLYGLHPSMVGAQSLFNTGKLAVVSNVGPLVRPINKTQYLNGSVETPAQLYSHSDQSLMWQTRSASNNSRIGWGGKLADLFFASNTNTQLSMNVSLDGENVYQAGEIISPYFLNSGGPEEMWAAGTQSWNAGRRNALMSLFNQPSNSALERAYSTSFKRTFANYEAVSSALTGATDFGALFPNYNLAQQLEMVAKMISVQSTLGMSRQVFFVGVGGFDTHDDHNTAYPDLMQRLSQSMKAFYDAMVQIGKQNDVTTFTASEFGRSTTINGDGTDHAWGAHHLVMGGRVTGQRFYGTMPNLLLDGPDDSGYGQIIPTTSVDQYAATLSNWFGLTSVQDQDLVFPNLDEFATRNLGFMQIV